MKKLADELEKCGFEVSTNYEVNYLPEEDELDKCYEIGKQLAREIKDKG